MPISNEDSWTRHLELYIKYKNKYQKEPPVRGFFEGVRVGAWLNQQRVAKRKGKLSASKIKRLEDAGVRWDASLDQWMSRLEEFKVFLKQHGRNPSFKDQEHEDTASISRWAFKQRDRHRLGKLPEKKVTLLSDAGIVWGLAQFNWDNKIAAYIAFKKKYKREPMGHEKYRGISLGAWSANTRNLFGEGHLPRSREKDLISAKFPFVYEAPLTRTAWEKVFKKYSFFMKKHKRTPRACKNKKETRLYQWLAVQKTKYQNGKLSDHQIKELTDLGISLDKQSASWENGFAAFKDFISTHRIVPSGKDIYNEIPVGVWKHSQRSRRKTGKLADVLSDRLNMIYFPWSPKEEKQFLKLFVGEIEEREALEAAKQAEEKKKKENINKTAPIVMYNVFSEDDTSKCDKNGVPTFPGEIASLKAWNIKYVLLKAYIEETDSFPVTNTIFRGERLGAWMAKQRSLRNKGKLSQERIDKLNALRFLW